MTDDDLMAYLVECVQNIRFGADLTDDQFITICKSIGTIPAEVLHRMTTMDGTPEEIAKALGGRSYYVEVKEDGTEETIEDRTL